MRALLSSKRRACAFTARSRIFHGLARSCSAQAVEPRPRTERGAACAPAHGCRWPAIDARAVCRRAEKRCSTGRRRVLIASRRLRTPRLRLQSFRVGQWLLRQWISPPKHFRRKSRLQRKRIRRWCRRRRRPLCLRCRCKQQIRKLLLRFQHPSKQQRRK